MCMLRNSVLRPQAKASFFHFAKRSHDEAYDEAFKVKRMAV